MSARNAHVTIMCMGELSCKEHKNAHKNIRLALT